MLSQIQQEILACNALLFVVGRIGLNANNGIPRILSRRFAKLKNIAVALKARGVAPEHVVRMSGYIGNRVECNARLKELGMVYRKVMNKNLPAITCLQVAALVGKKTKIKIEVTAVTT